MPTTPAGELDQSDVLRWYTRARRIPTLIGKLHGSERGIPGGPYTLTQVAGAAAVGFVTVKSEFLWGQWGFFGDKIIIVGVTIVALFALKFVKTGGRDPLTALTSTVAVATGGRYGHCRGARVTSVRSVRVRSAVRVLVPAAGTAYLAHVAWAPPTMVLEPDRNPSRDLAPDLGRVPAAPADVELVGVAATFSADLAGQGPSLGAALPPVGLQTGLQRFLAAHAPANTAPPASPAASASSTAPRLTPSTLTAADVDPRVARQMQPA